MTTLYTRVDETILAALRAIVGEANVSNSAEDREKYNRSTGMYVPGGRA